MNTEFRSFTKADIDAILDGGENYRKFREPHARKLLADMLDGRWLQPHPAPIVLSKNGKRCLDGQHRLWSAREYLRLTGRKIKFLVFYAQTGTEESITLTVDGGLPRRLTDWLRNEGCMNVVAVASAVRIGIGDSDPLKASAFDNTSPITVANMADFYTKNAKSLSAAVDTAIHTCAKSGIGSSGLLAGVVFLISKRNSAGCATFFERLGSGENLSEGNPILVLRNYLLQRSNEGTRRAVIRRAVTAAIVIKAWNAWANGEKVKLLKWAVNGTSPDEFPQISCGDKTLFD